MLDVSLKVDIKFSFQKKNYIIEAGKQVFVDIGNGIAFDPKTGLCFDIDALEYNVNH